MGSPMSNTEKRIATLENKSAAANNSRRVIIAKLGETAEQAFQREGIVADDRGKVFVVTFKTAMTTED